MNNFITGSLNFIENLPNYVGKEIDLGDRDPAKIRQLFGLNEVRNQLFPQVSSNFRYWQFAVWAEKHRKISAKELNRVRAKVWRERGFPRTVGPKSPNGMRNGADWLRKLGELKAEADKSKRTSRLMGLEEFIRNNSSKVATSSLERGLVYSFSNLHDRNLNRKWKRALESSLNLTLGGKEFFRIIDSNGAENANVDIIVKNILKGEIPIKVEIRPILIPACAVYAMLRALYGWRDKDVDEVEESAITSENIIEAKSMAQALLKGLQTHSEILSPLKFYRNEVARAIKQGPIWNDVWKRKSESQRANILIGFKFKRFINVYYKSFRLG